MRWLRLASELFCEVVGVRWGGVVPVDLARLGVEAWIWGLGAVGWSEAESSADVVQRRRPCRIEDEAGFVDGAVVVVAEKMLVLLQEGFRGSEVRRRKSSASPSRSSVGRWLPILAGLYRWIAATAGRTGLGRRRGLCA